MRLFRIVSDAESTSNTIATNGAIGSTLIAIERDAVAKALTAMGYPVKPATLATKATRGGSPLSAFRSPAALQMVCSASWAESRLSEPRSNRRGQR